MPCNSRSVDWRPKVQREKLIIAAPLERAAQIIEQARDHGRVTTGDLIGVMTGANRNTLKEHFRRLVEQGRLAESYFQSA